MEEFDLVYGNIVLRIYCDSKIAGIVKTHFLGHVIVKEPTGEATIKLFVSDNINVKNCEVYKNWMVQLKQ